MTEDTRRRCSRGHPMTLVDTFRFDHEASDAAQVREALERLQATGIELGAEVTLWQCPICGQAEGVFTYEPPNPKEPER